MAEKTMAKRAANKADGAADVLAAIASMPEADRAILERLHHQSQGAGIVAEDLVRDARLYEGRQSRLLLRSAEKFKQRYMTLGFNDGANLDEGEMWPVYFALKALTGADGKRVAALVKKAVR
jgi:hypothetical protein